MLVQFDVGIAPLVETHGRVCNIEKNRLELEKGVGEGEGDRMLT